MTDMSGREHGDIYIIDKIFGPFSIIPCRLVLRIEIDENSEFGHVP